MNDPNDTTDGLVDDLEEEFRGLVEAGDPRALEYAIEHATPQWVAQEFAKRVAATEEMVAEWQEEAAGPANRGEPGLQLTRRSHDWTTNGSGTLSCR